jgi:hypothetical protein
MYIIAKKTMTPFTKPEDIKSEAAKGWIVYGLCPAYTPLATAPVVTRATAIAKFLLPDVQQDITIVSVYSDGSLVELETLKYDPADQPSTWTAVEV